MSEAQGSAESRSASEAMGSPVAQAISVVIPTLGRNLLERCLEAMVLSHTRPVRLVLVDQGENRAIADWVARLRDQGMSVEHIRAERRGRAAAVNRGIECVESRFVAVTDDDCLVEPEWLTNMLAHLKETPEAIVTGRVEPEGENVVAAVTALEPALYRRPRLKHDSLSGGNMGASVGVLATIGPLDEDPRLAWAEDCEYSYRALRSGVPIRYAPDVVVRHVGWRDAAERAAHYRTYARSHGVFLGKYLRRGDPFIAVRTLVVVFRAAKRLLRGLATDDAERVAHGRAYMMGIWPGVVAGWRTANGRPGEGSPGEAGGERDKTG